MLIYWVILIAVIYLILVFLIPLIFFPNFLIFKPKINITKKIKKIAENLKGKNKEETLKRIFDYVQKMYSSERYKLFLLPYKHFYYNVDKFVDKKQFFGCNVQSLVLRTLLLATNQFSEKDLKRKIVMTSFGTIHQYYLVNVKNKVFKADSFFNILEEKR
jgi:hypothetical protein